MDFKCYNVESGLLENTVLDFKEDKYGFLWLVTQNGIGRYANGEFEQHFYIEGSENCIYDGFNYLYLDEDSLINSISAFGVAKFNYQEGIFEQVKKAPEDSKFRYSNSTPVFYYINGEYWY
ncbi:MAG: hypothetical protein MK078_00730 [Crocinitomicaceae bacterium]|nr:hypothetical protein [Crocinitomicaceae bacterium]